MTLSDDGNRAYVADPGGNMADPRRQRDPGAQAGPAGARGEPPDVEVGVDPAERDPVQRSRQALRARVRRVHAGHDQRRQSRRGRRRRGSSTSATRRPRAWSPTCACRSTSRPTTRRRAATRARSAPSRATRRTTAASERETDPTIAACSFIASGLRVFDITDLEHPKEIAYYVAPTQPRAENGLMASDFAMSKPAIVPARHEVWYSDGATGFYVLRVAKSAWPGEDAGAGGAGKKGCLSVGRRIRHQGIGKVRLGMTRKALLRRLPAPRTRRSALALVRARRRQGHRGVHQARAGGAREHDRAGAARSAPGCAPSGIRGRSATASCAPSVARTGCSPCGAARSASCQSRARARSSSARCCAATCARQARRSGARTPRPPRRAPTR